MQPGLREHFHKLSLSPHVYCLCHQLSVAIVDETFRYSFNIELRVHCPARIKQNWIA